MEYLNSLKNLYSLNNSQLNQLKININSQITYDNVSSLKNSLNILMKQQSQIKGKIPNDNFNSVNTFIIELYSLLNDIKIPTQNIYSHVSDQSRFHLDPSILQRKQNLHNKQYTQNNLESNNSIDPYKLYGYKRGSHIDLNELKQKYRKYALDTHPDKNNGNSRNFNIIKNAFKEIYDDLKLKENDKQFNELKNNSIQFIQKQESNNYRNTDINNNNFNVNIFNKLYNENRLSNVNDEGYDEWTKNNSFSSDDIKRNTKLTNGNFNSMFDKNVSVSKELINYSTPKALFMNDDNSCDTLGQDRIDNFTGKSKSIHYTDYKEAHTTNRLVDPNAKCNTYKSIDDIKHKRATISELTADEIMELELEKSRQEEYEIKRQNRVRETDQVHFNHYNNIHNRMISQFK